MATLAGYFGGREVGLAKGEAAVKTIAGALAARAENFRWGEHAINGSQEGHGECALCGADVAEVLLDEGCSAVEDPEDLEDLRSKTGLPVARLLDLDRRGYKVVPKSD